MFLTATRLILNKITLFVHFLCCCGCAVCSLTPVMSFPASTKIEKEKKEHARQHGMIRTEISGAEIAEEMEKERRFFQLQMCEVSRRMMGVRSNC